MMKQVKKEVEMLFGNLIGSNIFNLGLILGTAAALRPIPVEGQGGFLDFGFLMVNALTLVAVIKFRGRIGRWTGLVLILFYTAFATSLAFV